MRDLPKAGDLIEINFDPQAGGEIQKRRPALVMSEKLINDSSGFVWAVPITSTPSRSLTQQVLPPGQAAHGTAKIEQMKSMDYVARAGSIIGSVPPTFLILCRGIANKILGS